MNRTNQSTVIKEAINSYLEKGVTDKQDIYTKVVDELGVPRPTVRRVARDLRNELSKQNSDFTIRYSKSNNCRKRRINGSFFFLLIITRYSKHYCYKLQFLRYFMGYLGNHLATIVTGVFAAVLTGLWPLFVNNMGVTILNFVFIMAVPITWFLTLMCWLSQKSVDYVHDHPPPAHPHEEHVEKKNLNSSGSGSQQKLVYNADGQQVTPGELKEAKSELTDEHKRAARYR